MVKPYCELVVRDVLPVVRAMLAAELTKEGLTQAKAAAKLGVTQGAISQYRRAQRGWKAQKIEKDPAITSEIKKFAKRLIESETDTITVHNILCNVCKLSRARGLLCENHKECLPGLDNCKLCMSG